MDIRQSAKAKEGLQFLASQINPMTIVLKSLNIHEISRKATQTAIFWVIVSGSTRAEEDRLKSNFEPIARRMSMDVVFWTYGADRHGNLYIMAAVRNTIQYNQPTEQSLVRTAILLSILETGGGGQIPEADVKRALTVVFRKRIQMDMNIMLMLSQISFLNMNDQTRKHVVGGECIHILANSADLQFNCFVKSYWDMFLVKGKTPDAKIDLLRNYDPKRPPHNQGAFLDTRGLFRPCEEEIRMYLASYNIDDILVGNSIEVPCMLFSVIFCLNGDKPLLDAIYLKFLSSIETLSDAVHDVTITYLDNKVIQWCIAMVAPTRPSVAALLVREFIRKLNSESLNGQKKHAVYDAPIRTVAFMPFPLCGRSVLMECLRCNKSFKLKQTFEDLNRRASPGHKKPGYAHMLDLRKKENPDKFHGPMGAHRFFQARLVKPQKQVVSGGSAGASSRVAGPGDPPCESREHMAIMGMLYLKGGNGKDLARDHGAMADADGSSSVGVLTQGHAKRQRFGIDKEGSGDLGGQVTEGVLVATGIVEGGIGGVAEGGAPVATGVVDAGNVGGDGGAGGSAAGNKWAVAKLEIKTKFLEGVGASASAANDALTIMKKILDKVGKEEPGNTGIDIQKEIDAACNQLKLSFETLHQAGSVGIAMEALNNIQY